MERLQTTKANPTAKRSRRPAGKAGRKRAQQRPPMGAGAAAAIRASAGMGTEDVEPTEWLFGGSLISDH